MVHERLFVDQGVDDVGTLPTPLTKLAPASSNYLSAYLQALEGVGPAGARALRLRGIASWFDVLANPGLAPAVQRGRLMESAHRAVQALTSRDAAFFIRVLPRSEHWRIAAAMPERAVFLDIETTGLSRIYHRLTVIGWAQAGQFHATVGDPTAEQTKHLSSIFDSSILVTYNGAHFDVPFLRHHLPGLPLPLAHVDLRHLGQRLGLTGGQKKVEIALGLKREDDVAGLDGSAAPALWFRHQRGDKEALPLLLKYNHADVDGLRILLSSMSTLLEPSGLAGWSTSSYDDWARREGLTGGTYGLAATATKSGPRLTLAEVPKAWPVRVAGIDLSGGPKSVTGWALVSGADTETRALRTDDEIVAATLAADPDIVSIDAPLSLPVGRRSVDDDDPTRAEFGITRAAERELRRRGVNTYPALIRSMQGLTARGIRLATAFRQLGLPVIESFPGAMQDILGMPRKGLSLDSLKTSLAEYGLEGPFVSERVSHDEVDAISSAIVGQLFWEGKYEALGTPEEDFMIVPDVDAKPSRRHIIGLTGGVASGKSTLAAYLEEQGYLRLSYSSVLRSLFPADVGPADRTDLRALGARVHSEQGQRWLSQQVIDRAEGAQRIVIDGIRFPADRALMVERFGSAFDGVFLFVDEPKRRERYAARLDSQDSFDVADNAPTEKQVQQLRPLSGVTFDNSGRKSALAEFARSLATRS